MNNKTYLPIGTVVMLKGGKKRIMVIGYEMQYVDDKGVKQRFNYAGCLFPEGLINTNEVLLFNNNQIEKIYFTGYSDEEQKQFNTKLLELINKQPVPNVNNQNSTTLGEPNLYSNDRPQITQVNSTNN